MSLELTQAPTVNVGMLIRRPPEPAFAALRTMTSRPGSGFTKSSGKLAPGARVRWEWETYGVSSEVSVKEAEENRRLAFDRGREESFTTVEIGFIPWRDDTTYVQVEEGPFEGPGDELVAWAIESTGGWTIVLCAFKVLLEHDLVLTVVPDRAPAGLELG